MAERGPAAVGPPGAWERPLEHYGLIGDSTSAALINRGGELAWLCLPHLGSPSLFGSLLGEGAGGWRLGPAGGGDGQQRYHPQTALLDTVFTLEGGLLTVTDFMPWRVPSAGQEEAGQQEAGPDDGDGPDAAAGVRLVRRVQFSGGGAAQVASHCVPRPRYGGAATLTARGDSVQVAAADHDVADDDDGAANDTGPGRWQLWSSVPQRVEGDAVTAHFTLRPGQTVWFALSPSAGAESAEIRAPDVALLERLLQGTLAGWRGWLRRGEQRRTLDAAPHRALLTRAAITLKLLSAPGGAIAAAATTSLPEVVGGGRNWDYRYSWLRDGSFTAQALHHLGHREEAAAFLAWFRGAARRGGPDNLKIAYALDGSEVPAERELPLPGYRDSRPVRVGNGARDQRQLDIYGEVIAAYFDSVRYGQHALSGEQWQQVGALADAICDRWRDPDQGIWEARQPGQHHTYSKLMCWVGLDRAVRLGRQQGREPSPRWERDRDELRARLLSEGYSARLGSFTQTFGGSVLDATGLLVGVMEFLPADDPRVRSTVRALQKRLADGPLVRRYDGDDGLGGQEGYFLLCSFWLVSALALMGELDEARALLDRLLEHVSPLGLLAEEVTPDGRALIGNFPQAYSHVGLVNAVLYLQRAEGRLREQDSPRPLGGGASGELGQ